MSDFLNDKLQRPGAIVTLVFLIIFFISCRQTKKDQSEKTIDTQDIDSVELIQVEHPYLGKRVDRKILDKKYWTGFLDDFADKREEILKFYSCYVIKIHLKNQRLLSYRTNGRLFEKFKDDSTIGIYFKLNQDTNLVTKYWGIREEAFCDTISH